MQSLFMQIQGALLSRLARVRRRSTGSEGARDLYVFLVFNVLYKPSDLKLFRPWEKFHLLLGVTQLSELQASVLLYKLYSSVFGVRLRITQNLVGYLKIAKVHF